MTLETVAARLLGIADAESVEGFDLSFAAPWVRGGPAWLIFALVAALAVAVAFYLRFQSVRQPVRRTVLAGLRAGVLVLLVTVLAEPVALVHLRSRVRPELWFLVDSSESMAIRDAWSPTEQSHLAEAVGMPAGAADSQTPPARIDYINALRSNRQDLFDELARDFQLRWFVLDRPDGVTPLETSHAEDGDARDRSPETNPGTIAAECEVTALGAGLADLARRRAGMNLAAAVLLSDFNQNAGPPPGQAAESLGVPLFVVGLGPTASADLAVELQLPPLLKKDERASLSATVRQEGFTGGTAQVRFSVRRVAVDPQAETAETLLGARTVRLDQPSQTVSLTMEPRETGHFEFIAEVDPLPGETVVENNRSVRDNYVRDYFLRLLFAEYEPTWEWRFVKEVFHRDRLIGQEGFRTYLRSADLTVRRQNPLFLNSLSLPRSEFFRYDVIVLGDLPDSALTSSFCEMTEEFVSELGGGLVVLAGPRFGVGRLANTPLGDLLPVNVAPHARIRDARPFQLQRTAEAELYDFMQLGDDTVENDKAWLNLGRLPWYQPVESLRPMATALAVHPSEKCVDGTTPQPIIAVQNYGRGEVVYIGFNELWRLRRKYGELYYRRFWGQLIHRLALRHALGSQKRFVLRSDRRAYPAGETATLTVEAYDADFRPLDLKERPEQQLEARVALPAAGDDEGIREVTLSAVRPGLFQGRFAIAGDGEYRFQVRDPISGEWVETRFQGVSRSVERQTASRNLVMQRRLAELTGGRSYELTEIDRLTEEIPRNVKTETTVEEIPLWNNWLTFVLIAGALLAEWFWRKRSNLA